MALVSRKAASFFLLVVMVLSALGVYNSQPDNSVKYNGFTFNPIGTGWQVRVNNQQYQFLHLPTELDFPQITLPQAEKVYVAYDPSAKNITVPLGQVSGLLLQFGMRAIPACIQENGCPPDLPVISCDTANALVLYFRSAEEKQVLHQDQCTIIQAPTSLDFEKAVEKMAYQLVGIMSRDKINEDKNE